MEIKKDSFHIFKRQQEGVFNDEFASDCVCVCVCVCVCACVCVSLLQYNRLGLDGGEPRGVRFIISCSCQLCMYVSTAAQRGGS